MSVSVRFIRSYYLKNGKTLEKILERFRKTVGGKFSGIPEISGNFSGNLGVFLKTRAVEQIIRW